MLHYFNPGHETAVLNASKYYMAPANVVSMQKELSFLPAWYSQTDDFVLIDTDLPDDFLAEISVYEHLLPQWIVKNTLAAHADELANQEVCLWGITPQAIHLFDSINEVYGLNLT
ncbi:MAG: hypothetical protein LBR34_02635, partial [Prevotella sp.]|nr:hypothetical protein [Prevotella sp.]